MTGVQTCALPISLIAVIVAVGGLYVSRNIATQTDPEKFVPSDSAVLKDLHVMRDVAGTTSELNLLVETSGGLNVTDQPLLDWMAAFENRQRAQHPELRESNSVASFTTSITGAPPTTADVQQVLSTSPKPLVDMVIAADERMANITFAISDEATLGQQRDITAAILRGVLRVFEDFRYVREITDANGHDHALVFEATVAGKRITGCDFIHTDDDGLIDDFMVMVRPLSGAQALSEAMAAQFPQIQREALEGAQNS